MYFSALINSLDAAYDGTAEGERERFRESSKLPRLRQVKRNKANMLIKSDIDRQLCEPQVIGKILICHY